jgi:TfoX/Sxy family transcriptional regulator of competence genes
VQFEQTGSRPFVYVSQSWNVQLSYWSAPVASLDSPAEMGEWSQSAFGSALRAQAAKARKGKGK